jgi:hypothetical protein
MSVRRNRNYPIAAAFEETEGVELDGLRVIFDQKVGLFPADLHKKSDVRRDKPRPAANTARAYSRIAPRRNARAW